MEDVLKVIEMVATDGNDRPRTDVIIANCGQLGSLEHIDVPPPPLLTIGSSGTNKNNNNEEEIQLISESNNNNNDNMADRSDDNNINNKSNNNNNNNNNIDEEEEIDDNPSQFINIDEKTKNMTTTQKKLFLLRMKINQSRKANKEETIAEFKRFSDPKYDAKQRYLEKKQQVIDAVDKTSRLADLLSML
jgi:hypothetical protein